MPERPRILVFEAPGTPASEPLTHLPSETEFVRGRPVWVYARDPEEREALKQFVLENRAKLATPVMNNCDLIFPGRCAARIRFAQCVRDLNEFALDCHCDQAIVGMNHTFVADRASWDTITDDLPQYSERQT